MLLSFGSEGVKLTMYYVVAAVSLIGSFEWIHEAVTDYYDMAMISHHDAMIGTSSESICCS